MAETPDALARHAEAVATVRAFAERARAERVVLLVDASGDGREAVMVDGDALGRVEVTGGGEPATLAAREPAGAQPRPLPELRPAPPTALHLDPDTGELEAPLGAVANLARGVLALAAAFGGRSVATADFATREPGQPLTIAARVGEPLVVAAGDRRFELPPEALGA